MTSCLLILSFLLRYVQPAIASVSDLDVRQASADSSNTRSLWSIVSGCLATIFACTWISVHSNIPAPTDSTLQVLGRRLAIMLYLLIAPEFVIAWAARQYIASREIHRRHKARGWTKTHAFFVIMGGFSLYENGENGKLVRTLDIFELEKLEKEGKVDWPIITEEEIKDKSKGDYFSKGVVVLQTCWFIAQVIARGAEHLVVTELEVVTLAFSALTMILYFLWWNKPLDVGVSVPVHLKPLAVAPPASALIDQDIRQIPSPLQVYQDIVQAGFSRFLSRFVVPPFSRLLDGLRELALLFFDTVARVGNLAYSHRFAIARTIPFVILLAILLAILLVILLVILLAILLPLVGVPVGITAVFFILNTPLLEFILAINDMLACKKLNNWYAPRVPTFYCPKSESENISYIITIGVGIGFGSIHCIAWHFPFPSFTELRLWRITSILVTSIPVAVVIVLTSIRKLTSDDEDDSKDVRKIARWFGMICSQLLYSIIVLAYIGARFCLLVLPLYALRALPEGAYDDVDWTEFVPHIQI